MMWVDAGHTAIRDGGRVIPADPSIPEFAAIDLSDVAEYVPPPPTADDYSRAIDAHADAVARARGYRDGDRLASYVGSTNAAWSAEAHAFVAWRDGVWVHALTLMASVQGGQVPPPTVEAVIAGLPVIAWPE